MVPLLHPWPGYANRGRPDADDDADANEQNMRRHPLPLSFPGYQSPFRRPTPSSIPSISVLLSPLTLDPRYRLSLRVLQKNKKTPNVVVVDGRETRNENKTIYPADYFRPTPPFRSRFPSFQGLDPASCPSRATYLRRCFHVVCESLPSR